MQNFEKGCFSIKYATRLKTHMSVMGAAYGINTYLHRVCLDANKNTFLLKEYILH